MSPPIALHAGCCLYMRGVDAFRCCLRPCQAAPPQKQQLVADDGTAHHVSPRSSHYSPLATASPPIAGPRPIGSEAESLALKASGGASLPQTSCPTLPAVPFTTQLFASSHTLSDQPLTARVPAIVSDQHALDRFETIREKYPEKEGSLRLETHTATASGGWKEAASQPDASHAPALYLCGPRLRGLSRKGF